MPKTYLEKIVWSLLIKTKKNPPNFFHVQQSNKDIQGSDWQNSLIKQWYYSYEQKGKILESKLDLLV